MRCAHRPMRPGSTPSGITKPARGRRTTVSESTTYCCRRRRPTVSPRPASTSTCAPGRNHPTTCRCGPTSRSDPTPYPILVMRRSCHRCEKSTVGLSALAAQLQRFSALALEVLLEEHQRERALVLGRLLEGRVVELLDPAVVAGACRVAAERQPHQPACGL